MAISSFRIRLAATIAVVVGHTAPDVVAGDLLVADSFSSAVLRYNGTTGTFAGDFVPSTDPLPQDLIVGPDGHLYVATFDRIKRFDGSSGAFIDDFVPPGGGGLVNPGRMVFGPDGLEGDGRAARSRSRIHEPMMDGTR